MSEPSKMKPLVQIQVVAIMLTLRAEKATEFGMLQDADALGGYADMLTEALVEMGYTLK